MDSANREFSAKTPGSLRPASRDLLSSWRSCTRFASCLCLRDVIPEPRDVDQVCAMPASSANMRVVPVTIDPRLFLCGFWTTGPNHRPSALIASRNAAGSAAMT